MDEVLTPAPVPHPVGCALLVGGFLAAVAAYLLAGAAAQTLLTVLARS